MDQESLQHAEDWAVKTFGAAELGDPRRTDRLLRVSSALAANPSASLPQALESWGETLAAYRFLGNDAIRYQDILLPHWSQIYHEATQCPRTLLLADTTEFDFSTHPALKGLGPMGNSKEDIGFSLHTVLAMNPQTRASLGVSDPRTLSAQARPCRGNEGPTQETGARIAGLGAECETDRTSAGQVPMDLRGG